MYFLSKLCVMQCIFLVFFSSSIKKNDDDICVRDSDRNQAEERTTNEIIPS